MKNGLALFLELIAIALCGVWFHDEYQKSDGSIYEPIIVFLLTSAAILGVRYLIGKRPEPKIVSDSKQPQILGSNDRKTDPKSLVGRKGLLKQLQTTMQKHGKAALINGMGGIGKTTLAEAYVYEYGPKYDHILWIEQTGEQLEEDFISDPALLEHLGIADPIEDKQELFRQVIQKLKTIPGANNLLVIDNAESGLERYLELLPGHPQWHVLATSRYQMEGMHPVPLDFLSEAEAIQLFNQEAHEKLNQTLVTDLVKMVEYHTLSITLLAKTARHYDSDLERLKTVFDKDLHTKVYLKHARDQVEQVKAYLISIFSLNDLTEDQIWVLQQFVCLPPDYYDHDWLKDWTQPEDLRADQFNPLLSTLSDLGWLMTRKLHAQQWKLHRLIREVLLEKHPPTEAEVLPLMNTISSLLEFDQAKENPIDKFQWVPYGKAMLEVFGSSLHEQVTVLQNNLALVLQDLGDYHGAKQLLEKAMDSAEKNFGTEHPTTAVRYSNLATVLKDLGELKNALTLAGKALGVFVKTYPEGHPYIQRVRDNIEAIKAQMEG